MNRGLVASLAFHTVVVTALLTALPSSELLPALFVDLTAVDSGDERAGPAPVPPTAARRLARRQPETSAPALPSSGPTPVAEAPALPPAPPLPPPMTASPEPAAEPAPPAPALSVPPAAEPESPSASAVLSDLGDRAAPPEPSSAAHPGGGSASDEAPGSAAAASGVGVALAPDQRSARPPSGSGGGDSAGQELARQSPGSEGEAGALYAEYLAGLRKRIHAALRYPSTARRRGLTGAVTIELTILPSGMIRDVSIVKSSAHRLLDEAAVETVRKLQAQPFPASVPARTLRVRLPIVFELQ